jgi:hypothetical protein
VSIIIRRYADHMKLAAYMAVSFITFFHIFGSIFDHFICGLCFFVCASVLFCKLCILIVTFTHSYCDVCSVLDILSHCVVLCIVCVQMYTVLLPPGGNQTEVNKYIISYCIISYILYYTASYIIRQYKNCF